MLGGILFLQVESAVRALNSASGKPLNALEERHLKLTEQTVLDMNPKFTQSFSEPLKRMAPHRTDGIAQPLWPWVAACMHETADVPGSLRRVESPGPCALGGAVAGPPPSREPG